MNGKKLGAKVWKQQKKQKNTNEQATRNTNQYEEKHYLHTNQHQLNTNQRPGILQCDWTILSSTLLKILLVRPVVNHVQTDLK